MSKILQRKHTYHPICIQDQYCLQGIVCQHLQCFC